jgi:hypothetical protein
VVPSAFHRRLPAPSHGHVHGTHYSPQSFTDHANRVVCAASRPRYFHRPCASLTVILSLVISALLRPLATTLLLLTHLLECLGHPRASSTAHGCLCINSPPQRSSPKSMIGTSPSSLTHCLAAILIFPQTTPSESPPIATASTRSLLWCFCGQPTCTRETAMALLSYARRQPFSQGTSRHGTPWSCPCSTCT